MADTLTLELERIRAERRSATHWIAQYDSRMQHWGAWHNRIRDTDAIARGDFQVVFPDESKLVERPKVPNVVQLAIEDRVGLASSVVPTIRCDPANERAVTRCAKRERIAAHYLRVNRVDLMLPRFYADLLVAGANFKLVLPDEKSGFPCIRRLDPRTVYPDKPYSPDRPLANLLVSYVEKRRVLANEYPNARAALYTEHRESDSEDVEVIEFYDASELIRVAVLAHGKAARGTILTRAPNRLGRPPVVVSARPTHDGEFRGVYDQVLGVLNAQNRVFNLAVDAAADMVGSPMVMFDIENPDDLGRAVLMAKSQQGFARRMAPDGMHPQLFGILQQMASNVGRGAVYPEGRFGQVDQNIISAAGIQALQGNLITAVALDQRIEAASWQDVLSLALEIDERYLDAPKFIAGSVDARSFAESYTPSKDIRGDYQVRVEYGGAAGGDQFNFEIRLGAAVDRGLISRRSARERHSMVDDVLKQEREIIQEAVLQAGLSFIQQQAAQGNFGPAAALNRAIEDNENVFLTLAQFGEIQQAATRPALQSPPGNAEIEAFQAANAAARGAAGPSNVPGVGALPPLAELLVS